MFQRLLEMRLASALQKGYNQTRAPLITTSFILLEFRMTPNKKMEAPKFLAGWKEIANYLDKGVRTVQRYEREMGLPVRRPAGKSRAAVLATRAELDAWVAASPIREAFKISRPVLDDGSAFAGKLVNRIEEMRALRDQMTALRNELRGTMDVLRESIMHVHTGLTPPALAKTFSIASFDFNNKAVVDLVGRQALRKEN
jgi:hypothetical protein